MSTDQKSAALSSPQKAVGVRAAPPGTPLTSDQARPQATPGTATLKRALEAQGWTSELAVDLSMWFVAVLPGTAMKSVNTAEDFFDRLQTGVELCDLINKIAPDYAIASIARDAKPQSYQAYDNIKLFLDAAKKIGVHDLSLFVVDDLIQRKSDKLVVNTLLQLSDLTNEKYDVPRVAIRDEVRQAFASPQKKANGGLGTAVGAGVASGSAVHGSAHKKSGSGSTQTAVGHGVVSSFSVNGTSADGKDSASGASKRGGQSSDASTLGTADGDDDNDEAGSGDDAAADTSDEARAKRRAERRAAREARKCHGGGSGDGGRRGGAGGCGRGKCKRSKPSDTLNPDKMFFGLLLFAAHATAYILKRRSGK